MSRTSSDSGRSTSVAQMKVPPSGKLSGRERLRLDAVGLVAGTALHEFAALWDLNMPEGIGGWPSGQPLDA